MGYLERPVVVLEVSQGYSVFETAHLDVREKKDEYL
jgi:hypothetical protein